MYLPGDVACFPPDVARDFCTNDPENPAATLYAPKTLDAPPRDKMAKRPDLKKETHA